MYECKHVCMYLCMFVCAGFELTFQSCIIKNCMVKYDWAIMIESDGQKIL